MFKISIIFFIITCTYSSLISASSLRITTEELNQILLNENVVVLDVRSKDDYDVEHIKGAISFPVALTFLNREANGKIQKPQLMQKYLQQRGISIRSKIILYDGGEIYKAARVFWALEVYGLTKIKILEQGFNDWIKKGLASSQKVPKIQPSAYITRINHKRLASKFVTQLAINNKNKIIIDARSRDQYLGKISIAKRFGHIASAINVPFSVNLTKNANFSGLKALSELKSLYAGIPLDKKVIIYCKIGLTSTTNYFALRELGYDVANYDASWREWGNDETLPIEK